MGEIQLNESMRELAKNLFEDIHTLRESGVEIERRVPLEIMTLNALSNVAQHYMKNLLRIQRKSLLIFAPIIITL